jgi:anti-sigma regulatory factor (Ser/Thr protein kinase)
MTMSSVARPQHRARPLVHEALLYRTAADFVAGVTPFVTAGLDADEPVFVAVPTANLEALHHDLNGASEAVVFADMTSVGRNPARIIPSIRGFVDDHPGRRVRFVGEPIWPGRSPAEICEATRHEAMLNAAFADADVAILCPYDVDQLAPDVVADAWRTHPMVLDADDGCSSPHYSDPTSLYTGDAAPLGAPPADSQTVSINQHDLRGVRSAVRGFATNAGLAAQRIQDLVLAANEIATNTVSHTARGGQLSIWRNDEGVVCEVRDSGHIADPLAGRRLPEQSSDHGRGLWMANQLCDLVQLRSTELGTTVRLHINW